MLKLNLLPPQEKQELERSEIAHWFISFWVMILVGLIIFSLLLLGTYWYLVILLKAQNELIAIEQSNVAMIKQISQMETKIEQINQNISQIYLLQKDFIPLTPILEEIAKIVPQGIYLNNFSYQASTHQVNLNGHAGQREQLLLFQKALEENPCLIELEAPLSNLLKQKDIDFSFSFTITQTQ
jgi:Tfp pilus assembly protein PilN